MSDMELVMTALGEYGVKTAGETFSMEVLLRIEAELERLQKGMRCQHHIAEDVECEDEATRRAIVRWVNPPISGQEESGERIDMVQACFQHDPV
jgi:hypothetical protein